MTQHRKTTVHVVQHLKPGGLECLVLDFVRFAKADENVFIVALEGEKQQAIQDWPLLATFESQLHFMNKGKGVSPALLMALKKRFKQWQADVVHTHHIGPLLYGGLAATMAKVPCRLHTEHDAWHLQQAKHYLFQSTLLNWVSPTLVADAPAVAQGLSALFPNRPVLTIPNGIDTRRFTPLDKIHSRKLLGLEYISKDKTVVGSAGRLESVKGHDVLIKAMRALPKEVHLVIAGHGSQRAALEALISKLNLSDRVTLLGAVDRMPEFYSAIDLFCLPSRAEGFPLSALEAQACQTPTIVTNVGSSADALCPHSGIVCAANKPYAMAKSIAGNIQAVERAKPRTHIRQHFDVRQMLSRYQNLTQTGGVL